MEEQKQTQTPVDPLEQMMTDLRKKHLVQESQQNLQDSLSPACSICGGDEWIPYIAEQGVTRYRPCSCRQKAIIANRFRFAELPATYQGVKLNNFDFSIYKTHDSKQKIAIAGRAIKHYLDNFQEMQEAGMGLYIFSTTKGSGKTRMVASIANELLKSHQVKFAVSTNILKEIKATWSDDNKDSESKLLDFITNTEILIIDDFGTETHSNWIDDKFYHIINERYVNKRVTLFTSNEALHMLKYDERITNRIKERTYQIEFPNESIREYIAQHNNQELIEQLKNQTA